FDLIAIGAGTSKGRADFTAEIVGELGEVSVHGVAYHPGHPVLLGMIAGSAVIGIPGYPVATWLAIMQFVQPLIERYLGIPHREPPTVRGSLARRINSALGYREFVRVSLERTERGYLVQPLSGGSSRLSSLIRADGIVEVPEELEGYNKGEEVEVKLLRSLPSVGGYNRLDLEDGTLGGQNEHPASR
ncbi:MAG: molybdopterin-binding protein, partial [Candidatus Bipolaricaulia bacterium]